MRLRRMDEVCCECEGVVEIAGPDATFPQAQMEMGISEALGPNRCANLIWNSSVLGQLGLLNINHKHII